MGEKTIATQIKINGDITPDFSYDWEVVFQGEKYIHPLRTPQATKENTSLNSTVDLTFQHWAVYQLKRQYFFTVQPIESGTVIADKYIASVKLSLGDFCTLLGQVLQYYYGDKITIDLNPQWEYSADPTGVEISNSYMWDVLVKLYELYAVRWAIEPAPDNDNETTDGERYVIKVGYAATELSHIFEYGFEGGLLKVERQVQSEEIRNMIRGRGGEKNLPYRYFKNTDPANPTFPKDPDWIPELANVYFDRLRGKTFRDYIKGWKTNPNRQLTWTDSKGDTHSLTVEPYDAAYGVQNFAYALGHIDERFNPVEYVADGYTVTNVSNGGVNISPATNSSIARYGELMGALDDNEDIYPTIQGVEADPYGRADEAVAAELIESDDFEEAVINDAQVRNMAKLTVQCGMNAGERKRVEKNGIEFNVPEGQTANYEEGVKNIKLTRDAIVAGFVVEDGEWKYEQKLIHIPVDDTSGMQIENAIITVVNVVTGEERSCVGIPAGTYYPKIKFDLYNSVQDWLNVTVECPKPKLTMASATPQWTNTWNVWVKNIWGTSKGSGETAEEYAHRVWDPILGDREGGQAKMVFSDGMLSTSEDYEFVITGTPKYEKKQCSWETIENGTVVTHEYESEWRINLAKSDADLESTGLYVPSKQRQAKAGDHFFFVGIDMPHQYVLWAEKRLDEYKTDQMKEVSDIKPTWVVTLDKVRAITKRNTGVGTLLSQLKTGCSIRLADKRFILNEAGTTAAYETLYLQSVTYTYNTPSSQNAALIPDVEIALSDKYETVANPVETISGSIEAISKQLGSISNVEQIVRTVGDKLYLRKDGLPDRSMSPTEFASLVTSLGFRNGIVGGAGWGFFKDESGSWVLETDKINVRQDMQVNNLVINQVTARGGMIVESGAAIEIESVAETDDGFVCYFDTKEGTIANLFKENDVAYCNRYTPENEDLKFYKRKVVAVDDESVTLSKTVTNGTDKPSAGDVIVQYGSYTDVERQYVIVRDVIGGGYERFIEGLDSVGASGTEYYFVGRQAGMYNGKPRWYVGCPDSNIEYRDGKFSLNNVSLSVNSTIGDKPIKDYLAENIDIEVGGTNLVLKSDVGGPLAAVSSMRQTYDLSENVIKGTQLTFTLWGSSPTGTPNITIMIGSTNVAASTEDGLIWHTTFFAPSDMDTFTIRASVSSANPITVERIKLERGNTWTDWSPAPKDTDQQIEAFDYLRQALKESTMTQGGLIVASLMQLGYTTENGYIVTAGVNGICDNSKLGGGVAHWAGGGMNDADDPTLSESQREDEAQFLVRHDGTGYLAGNTVKFSNNMLKLGDNLRLSDNELFMLVDEESNIGFSLSAGNIGYSIPDAITGDRKWFRRGYIEVTNLWRSPSSQDSFISPTFSPKNIVLGNLGVGSTVDFYFLNDMDIKYGTGLGVVIAQPYGRLIARLLLRKEDGTTETAYETTSDWWLHQIPLDTSTGTYRYTANIINGRDESNNPIPLSVTIEQSGSYIFQIESIDTYPDAHPVSSKTKGSALQERMLSYSGRTSRQIVIGGDGIVMSMGDSLALVREEGIVLRSGSNYLKITPAGIVKGVVNNNADNVETPL